MGVLTNAALVGDLDRVRELLAQGHNINERDECNATPLHLAVANGDIELVCYLVEQGADLDAKAGGEYTPLFYSFLRSRFEIFEILLSHGADASARDEYGHTVLHFIAAREHDPTWTTCLFDSVDIDPRTLCSMKNIVGTMALHYSRSLASAKCLIEYGFDSSTSGLQSTWMCPTLLSIRNKHGKSPYDLVKQEKIGVVVANYLESFESLPLVDLATMKLSPGLNEFQCFLARRIYYTILCKLPSGPDFGRRIMAFLAPADVMK